MKKIIVGIILSIVLIYISLKGVEYKNIFAGLERANYTLLIPTAMLFTVIQLLRSLRWGTILSPIEKINQKKLFPITCIGFMAIALIPMRTGEIVRPYLISKESRVPFSSAMATILVERLLDSVTLIGILIWVLSTSHSNKWFGKSIYIFLLTFIIILFIVCTFHFKKQVFLLLIRSALRKSPEKARLWVEDLFKLFVEGFKLIEEPRKVLYASFLSVVIWMFSGLAIYILFVFSNIQLPIMSAFFVLVATIIVISLPAAPGFIGSFQFGCIAALSFYNVPKESALAFSMVYYAGGIGINILLGMLFLPFNKVSLKMIKKV